MIANFRFRARRRAATYYPGPARMRRLGAWAISQIPGTVLGLRVFLTLAVAAHLGVVMLFPAGRNALLRSAPEAWAPYLTLVPVGDALGFYKTSGQDGFLVYKIYAEDGTVVEGRFPDPTMTPQIRYDRWAMLSHRQSEGRPEFHAGFLDYLVKRLPTPPLKVELIAAKWSSRTAAPENEKPPTIKDALVLRKLGTYDGLRRQWSPSPAKKGP